MVFFSSWKLYFHSISPREHYLMFEHLFLITLSRNPEKSTNIIKLDLFSISCDHKSLNINSPPLGIGLPLQFIVSVQFINSI